MDLNLIWQDFLKIINEEEGSRIVETWFKAVSIFHWDSIEKTVILKAPNSFVREWISLNYLSLIKTNLSRLFNEKDIKIAFSDQLEQKGEIKSLTAKTENKKALVSLKKNINSNINIDYIFENFVVGSNNSLAYSACQAVALNPGVLYNPLFIYGASGLGKTHLLHAIANFIKSENSKLSVLYQSTDRFVNEFINAIRFNKVNLFENKYKSIDVLLIDDIQFISNKEQTQEAFFYIFNALYESKKQIVFSSDSLPHDISGIAERLRSRINSGLLADIQKPSLEMKIAILKKKAQIHKVVLKDEVAHYLASLGSCNVRELEGLFIRLLAFSSLMHEEISLETASKIFPKNSKNSLKGKNIDLNLIVKIVAKNYGLTLSELKSNKRVKSLSLARHIAMYLIKKHCSKSLVDIAAYFNRKDHSTVIHAIEKIENLIKFNDILNKEIQKIESKILK